MKKDKLKFKDLNLKNKILKNLDMRNTKKFLKIK